MAIGHFLSRPFDAFRPPKRVVAEPVGHLCNSGATGVAVRIQLGRLGFIKSSLNSPMLTSLYPIITRASSKVDIRTNKEN